MRYTIEPDVACWPHTAFGDDEPTRHRSASQCCCALRAGRQGVTVPPHSRNIDLAMIKRGDGSDTTDPEAFLHQKVGDIRGASLRLFTRLLKTLLAV